MPLGLRLAAAVLATCCLAAARPAQAADFTNFESAQVHPLALSADSTKLLAINTPDARLSIFDIADDGSLSLAAEVPVGVDPVSLALHDGEAWVVNHVSDSISVVDIATAQVVATIQTEDEPNDIVFANGRAFVSLAGRRDQVKVYDAATRTEVGQMDVFGQAPRALAVSADEREVYLVVLQSGNLTSVIREGRVAAGGGPPPPTPAMSPTLPPPPATALIVKFDPGDGQWKDETGKSWADSDEILLPDQDLFVIDSAAMAITRTVVTLGTNLFNVALRPGTGELWVTNTESLNRTRFEPNLRSHFLDTRVTVVDPGTGQREFLDLNPHINYAVTPGPAEEKARSVAIPGDTCFTGDGSTAYVASFGSALVAVLDAATGANKGHIAVGSGPSGLALCEARQRLYVENRLDNTISIVDTATQQQVATTGVAGPSRFDPTPDTIRSGRRFLYDATTTSGHGDSACASCHVFGDVDGLGWDLGDPTGSFTPYSATPWVHFLDAFPPTAGFHPMKGPMVTQTFRGLGGTEPLHWRGDKERFQNFNGAFVSLMGNSEPLAAADMDRFAAFATTIAEPPNPFRTLDDQLPATIAVPKVGGYGATVDADPSLGLDLYENGVDGNGTRNCVSCHPSQVGTDGSLSTGSILLGSQDIKVAQLRSMYLKMGFQKQGLFGGIVNIGAPMQKSGFGILHGGALSLAEFMFFYFLPDSDPAHFAEAIEAYSMAFPTGTAPIVGRQYTIDRTQALSPASDAEVARLMDQAAIGNCDLVVRGTVDAAPVAFLFDPATSRQVPNRRAQPAIEDATLRGSLADGDHLTYTAVPPGSGRRVALDRDRDSWLDGDEVQGGSSDADAASFPTACAINPEDSIAAASLRMATSPAPFAKGAFAAKGSISLASHPSPAIDPAQDGVVLDVRDATGASVLQRLIPASAWVPGGAGRWSFADKGGSLVPGITKATIRVDGSVASFDIRGKGLGAALLPSSVPLKLVVVFGTAEREAAGQCGRAALGSSACRFGGGSLRCR